MQWMDDDVGREEDKSSSWDSAIEQLSSMKDEKTSIYDGKRVAFVRIRHRNR
jgi:hypothetical protein